MPRRKTRSELWHTPLGDPMNPPKQSALIETAWKTARADPLDPLPWIALCNTCLAAGDVDCVVESIDHLEAMSLGEVQQWRALAEQFEEAGLWPEAYRAWRRVVEDGEQTAENYRRLANALSQTGELGLALVTLEAALRLEPTHAETHRMLARGHLSRGAQGRAREHAGRAQALEPEHPGLAAIIAALDDPIGPPATPPA